MRYLAVAVLCGLLVGLVPLAASADIILLDFGPSGSPLFSGTFDGSSGFVGAFQTNGIAGNVTFDLGSSRYLHFIGVGGWGGYGGGLGEPGALTNDYFYSAGGFGASNPVHFTLSGVLPTDVVTLELLGSVQMGADVTFGSSVTTTVPQAASSFTLLPSVTGSASYDGTFTRIGGGTDEANLSAARITFAIPEPGVAVYMVFGLGLGACVVLRRRFSR